MIITSVQKLCCTPGIVQSRRELAVKNWSIESAGNNAREDGFKSPGSEIEYVNK